MGRSQPITGSDVASVVSQACQMRASVSVCVHYQNRCLTYASRLLSAGAGKFTIETPGPVDGQGLDQVAQGDDCFVSFRHREFRYFLTSHVMGKALHVDKEGREIPAIDMQVPEKIDRQDRRAFERVDVPSSAMMRASVWSAPDRFPIWSGRVLNLSAGGLQIRTSDSAMGYFEPGDRISMSLLLSASGEPLDAEAYISYCAPDGDMAILGLALVASDIEFAPAQRQARDAIAACVAKLSHAG